MVFPCRMSVEAAPAFKSVNVPSSKSTRAASKVANASPADFVTISPFISRTAAISEIPLQINLRNISAVIFDSIAAFAPVPIPSESTIYVQPVPSWKRIEVSPDISASSVAGIEIVYCSSWYRIAWHIRYRIVERVRTGSNSCKAMPSDSESIWQIAGIQLPIERLLQ